jgi:crotonobetainyl-CoA:carnitine CoA-transferase CaiB-like acyl-CoA transferase
VSTTPPALDKPQHGVRVVESEGFIDPGPLAAMTLADLGAQTTR